MNERATERLVEEMGLDAAGVERRLGHVGLGEADARRIETVRPIVEEDAGALAETFFEFLEGIEEANGLLENRAAMAEARALKVEHIRAMACGPYDAAYARQRLRLALLYSEAKLDQKVFLGAFHHLMSALGRRVIGDAEDPVAAFDAFLSLKKVAFFDVGLIVDTLILERERIIHQQKEAIRELSTPVLQVHDRLLLLPLVGIVDSLRAKQLTQDLLEAIRATRAKVIVLDITGTAAVDTRVANHLLQTVSAARLMGATIVFSGVSSQVATTLVSLGVDVSRFHTVGDLQRGIEEAERILGMRLVAAEAAPAADELMG